MRHLANKIKIYFLLSFILMIFLAILLKRIYPQPYSFKDIKSPSSEYFLSYYNDHFSHVIAFHNLSEEFTKSMKQADVLFLGSSVCGFAYKKNLINDFFDNLNLKYFVLCFGNETMDFHVELIKKYDLKPKFVIIHDSDFYTTYKSGYYDRAVKIDKFGARKFIWNSYYSLRLRNILHKCVPHVRSIIRNENLADKTWIEYRSKKDGTTIMMWPKQMSELVPAAWPTENPIKDEEILLENASKFYQLIRKQGAIPIITASPSSNTTLEFVRKVANKNNVLFIPPVNDYLETYDGYHLSPEGAEVFTNNFLKELDLILSN